jgi:hypothetical protein
MSRSEPPTASTKNTSFILIIGGVLWAFLAAMFFLILGGGNSEPSKIYLTGTAMFEIVAFLVAAILCIRNSLSTNNVSGKSVWIGLGGGMLLYCIGSCLFAYWEVVLELSPDVSLGDLFYLASYAFLTYGMLRAVLERKLNLDPKQWAIVLSVGVVGVMTAMYVNNLSATKDQAHDFWMPAAIAQTTPGSKPTVAPLKATPKASPTLKPIATPAVSPSATPTPAAKPTPNPKEPTSNAPQWAKDLDATLEIYKKPINWIYIVADSCLLTIATALLTAFWGGRFSQSWRMIAFATFSLYIADIWVKYATNTQGDAYKSGSLPEVFFVFAGVLFAIGAVLEYDLSKSRRTNRRRS